ncbi:MAG: hypothetical protein M1825_002227 [Sarcosagium campestre]|nr:MAG: hypothetical protein M1825_002227 [Sarcosagium campestre]
MKKPPHVDNSPEDQAILEHEYQKHPKPDKAIRLDIVKRVALGEKEVQIWFQNRRQNDRRKSRPLLPHELLPPQRSDGPASNLAGDASPYNSPDETQIHDGPSDEFDDSSRSAVTSQDIENRSSQQSQLSLNNVSKAGPEPSSQSRELITSFSSESAIARESALTSTRSVFDNNNLLANKVEGRQKPHQIRRTASMVHLSLSVEGKAQVVTGEEMSPPKPSRLKQLGDYIPNGRLERSHSDLTIGEKARLHKETAGETFIRDAPVGRSRDSRAWEFSCDSEARDALSAKAELAQSGSAVGAIGLLRARSGNSLLPSVARQKEGHLRRDVLGRAKVKNGKGKSKLSRTSSAFARMQTNPPQGELSVKKAQAEFWSPSGDSDKENWVPGTREALQPRHRVRPTEEQSVPFHENNKTPSHCSGPGVTPIRNRVSKNASLENSYGHKRKGSGSEQGTAAKFVILEDESDAPRGAEDLDCVQNLLSLSQGNWR